MKSVYRWLILIALICAAISCYSYGSASGFFVFIVLGLVFEGAFWFKLFESKPKSN
ncbi:hypothetical protein GCM10017161_23630 [Thalassotalea marina]|uniref:Lipoprotein n=1 Tax=Thalassotalea marina TaxID=1673741 RepID=A0A919EKF7_9GAMM|nr:hypothetical protein GCM10017161_23630 [Thalassotalea marina]